MRRGSWLWVALILLDDCVALVARGAAEDEQQPRAVVQGSDGSNRPMRAGSGVFSSSTAGDAQAADDPVAEASTESQAATAGIVADMRAHLERRKKTEMADLIGKGPVRQFLDFFRSQYFRNVRRSMGVFLGAWLWYVLNSRTYIRPDHEE